MRPPPAAAAVLLAASGEARAAAPGELRLDTGVNLGLNPQTAGVQAHVGASQAF